MAKSMGNSVNYLMIKGTCISFYKICSLKTITILPVIDNITNIIFKI